MQRETWSIRSRSDKCLACGGPFEDGQTIIAELFWSRDEGYKREDRCAECAREKEGREAVSFWKTVFHVPAPPEEPLKKETAETLFRRLMMDEDTEHAAVAFVLAVMLERRRELIERDVKEEENGEMVRIYEHRRTGEIFVVRDPRLKLNELETVQQQVVNLLGG